MLLVGLSGSLGSGKSTVGRALEARGAAVIDTDQVAREVVAPGSAGAQAVFDHFGQGVRGADGAIDRPALAAIVFADPAPRAALEDRRPSLRILSRDGERHPSRRFNLV